MEAARAITEALAAFLQRTTGRGAGVLTPSEAREGFARLMGDREVADLAEFLVICCDRTRYGQIGEDSSVTIAEGRRFFVKVAEYYSKRSSGKSVETG